MSLRNALLSVLLLTAYAATAIGPWLLGQSLPLFQEKFLREWTDIFVPVFIAFLLLLFLLSLPALPLFFASKRAVEYFGFSTLMNGWMMGGTIIYAAAAYRIILLHSAEAPNSYERAIAIALVSMIAYVSAVLIMSYLLALVNRALIMRRKRMWPNAVVADLFLDVLWKTEKHPQEWKEVEFKREVIRKLEEIAHCIEDDLPFRLRTGNAGADFWQKQTAEQIGAGVRNLMRWVYTPKEDTRQQFINRTSNYLVLVLNGDWDGFERAEPQTVSRPELLRSRLKTAVTAVLSAMVPLLILLVVKRLNLIEGVVLSYLTVGAFIWTGLSLLSQVDPSYGSKLAAIKDISSLLPLPKRDKD